MKPTKVEGVPPRMSLGKRAIKVIHECLLERRMDLSEAIELGVSEPVGAWCLGVLVEYGDDYDWGDWMDFGAEGLDAVRISARAVDRAAFLLRERGVAFNEYAHGLLAGVENLAAGRPMNLSRRAANRWGGQRSWLEGNRPIDLLTSAADNVVGAATSAERNGEEWARSNAANAAVRLYQLAEKLKLDPGPAMLAFYTEPVVRKVCDGIARKLTGARENPTRTRRQRR